MSTYGTFIIHTDDDQTDRIGIRTLILAQRWQASRGDLTRAELDDETPATPEVPGGVLFIGRQTRRVPGGLRTSWTFEGIEGDGKSVTFKDRDNSLDYRFEPGFSEKSLLLLPGIQTLLDQYGGYVLDGQIIWPPTVPDETPKGGLGGKAKDAGKPNPLFGRDTFFMVEGTYLFRYASLTPPTDTGVGKIHKGGLPGRAPSYANRDWLKLPIPYQRRGPIFDCTEMYWLSGEGGWPVQIYGATPGGTGDGLTTGGLNTGTL